MNYRHVFHAGNFADCMKHALLVWLMGAMARKDTPFFVLDTHAGTGRYDLQSGPAAKTGEWRNGIARLLPDPPEPLAAYAGVVERLGLYPGSPALIRALLRGGDRLAVCELHPEDHAALHRLFARDRQVAVHRRDGWEALRGLLPPPERRALVLIDPPYEQENEHERLADALAAARTRFPGGVYAGWYPVKSRAPARALLDGLRDRGVRDVVAAELLLREADDPARLNGCGLVLVNPPWQFEQAARPILEALRERLGAAEAQVGRVTDE